MPTFPPAPQMMMHPGMMSMAQFPMAMYPTTAAATGAPAGAAGAGAGASSGTPGSSGRKGGKGAGATTPSGSSAAQAAAAQAMGMQYQVGAAWEQLVTLAIFAGKQPTTTIADVQFSTWLGILPYPVYAASLLHPEFVMVACLPRHRVCSPRSSERV